MKMAIIEASGELKGEASTEVRAGLRVSVSAQCYGRSSGGIGHRPPPVEEQAPTSESEPKGK